MQEKLVGFIVTEGKERDQKDLLCFFCHVDKFDALLGVKVQSVTDRTTKPCKQNN